MAFPIWINWWEKNHKPVLIANALWSRPSFVATCALVTLSTGAINAMELYSSLYFQHVQNASTTRASLYLLPSLLVGVAINLSVGVFVDRVPAVRLVVGASIICSASPLFMALLNPKWSYWYLEFWAQLLAPIAADVLFTIGLLMTSREFPEALQALARGVFNTVSLFGSSLGVGLCQVIVLSVSEKDPNSSSQESDAGSLGGYRAAFWALFSMIAVCVPIGWAGLRNVGKLGAKKTQ